MSRIFCWNLAAGSIAALTLGLALSAGTDAQSSRLRFDVTFPAAHGPGPFDGRLPLMISKAPDGEPRFQINDGPAGQLVFGIDVEGWKPGQAAAIDASVLGYPLDSLADVPAGQCRMQALLHKYGTFRRSDGHVVKLPMDRGEGQQWNRAPGNLYSSPQAVAIDPAGGAAIGIELDQVIPPIPDPPETTYVKHVRIQSERLTKFWGRPMHLGAHVLLPHGFDEHPEARYPLAIFHGHFPYTFDGFREEPPDPDLEPDFSARFNWKGYNRTQQELAHQLYTDWTSPGFPRMLVIQIQHANPYYDDSYAVNSANLGPYGDAITYELIPYIEERFRGLGWGWSRFLYDLSHILRRDWPKIGRLLEGKIHLYVGDMDNFYLNNAVYLTEAFLRSATDPPFGGEVDYGDRAEHCWNGDHTRPNALSRLRYHQMFAPKIVERMLKTARPGADVRSWRY